MTPSSPANSLTMVNSSTQLPNNNTINANSNNNNNNNNNGDHIISASSSLAIKDSNLKRSSPSSNNSNAIVPIDQSGAATSAARKSIDTFGQRTSIYRGVTK